MNNAKTSYEGRQAIIKEEGVKYKAYFDGAGVPTIGVGHTRGVHMGQKATEHEVDVWLEEDLTEAEQAVNNYVHVPLNQNMFDALVSLVYNIGTGAFRDSTLLRLLNTGLYKDASEQFLVWNKITVKGKKEESKGLTARRERERKLFLKPA